MVWTGWPNRERARWLGLVALALTASALIAAALASGESRGATSRAASPTRTDRTTSRDKAPRSDTAAANARQVFGGSVAPAVRAPRFAPAPAAPAANDVWSVVSSERSPSVVPVAGDGAAVSSSKVRTNLTLGVLLLGAGVLALLGGLAAATLHGWITVV